MRTRTHTGSFRRAASGACIRTRLERVSLMLFLSVCIILIPGVDTPALTVRRSPASSESVVVEISDLEARTVISDPGSSRRLAAQAGYRRLVLIGMPLPGIGEAAVSREGAALPGKYSTDIARCAKSRGEGFTLEYDIDIEKVRKTLQRAGTDHDSGSEDAVRQAISDIMRQLTDAAPRFVCPGTE